MEAAVHTTDTSPARGSCRFRIAAAAACVALLAVAWSSPGLAAARTSVGCDRVAHNLESLDVDTLAIEVVDLSDVEQAEPSDALADSVAPFLFLTPRVAIILEDVFGDSPADEAASEDTQMEAADAKEAKPATSPVVDNAPNVDAPVSPMYENAAILPRFQRQMYRTDI